ncbi:MAG: sugar phosphate isomerase/epimerase [Pirellulales bacterium]|nr:sugar phosphate isomerase/epimerase [Pirellulales bacterium]
MKARLHRRSFLEATGTLAAGFTLSGLGHSVAWAGQLPFHAAAHAEKLGWLLGCQAYTFRHGSFHEAIKKTASLGLGYIEAYPGQRLDKENPKTRMDVGLAKPLREEVKSRLSDAGVKLVNFGVCKLVKDEAESRRTFDFAKEMGVETLVAEPPKNAFDTVEKLCDEYAINVAIHNHPKPSFYWDYRTVLDVCKGRSKRIGACCDTGHWMRSGIEPLEALKALEGRIISFHLKDLNQYGVGQAHDVPWGTGKGKIREVLKEVRRQKFQGVFSIEYEHASPSLLSNIAECTRFFDAVAAEMAAKG